MTRGFSWTPAKRETVGNCERKKKPNHSKIPQTTDWRSSEGACHRQEQCDDSRAHARTFLSDAVMYGCQPVWPELSRFFSKIFPLCSRLDKNNCNLYTYLARWNKHKAHKVARRLCVYRQIYTQQTWGHPYRFSFMKQSQGDACTYKTSRKSPIHRCAYLCTSKKK